jgi:hypothetical protein
MSDGDPRRGRLGDIMNAIIVYDDNAIAAKAHKMLDRAARRADEALLWKVTPWRFDMLLWPATADVAFTDAQAAQLIVLAIREPAALPGRLVDWLERWALQRQVLNAALAVFDGKRDDSLAGVPTPALSQFAERHGLSFILDDVIPDEDESAAFLEDLHQREVAQTQTLAHIMEQA